MNGSDIDLTGLRQDVIEKIEHEIMAFTKMDLEVVRNRLGVVMFQVYTYGDYDPQLLLKADFSIHVKQAITTTKAVIKGKLCNQEMDAVEKTLTLLYIVKIITTELDWPESAVVLLGIFLIRRFGKGLAEWICSDINEENFAT